MGRYASEKAEFDELAKKFFEAHGYEAKMLGARWADVVAWNEAKREFAIIEVKGPWEADADVNYRYESSNHYLGGKTRKDLWELLKQESFAIECPGICRLIAFTITHQLYTYWKRSKEHPNKFQSKPDSGISPHDIKAFLVSPVERRRITAAVLEFLWRSQMIGESSVRDEGRICVADIRYPDA
ncbi:MAG: hypothetical protein HYY26_00905 [Acidobacteria bacterium]|nr:hypothetical protein [Acidobacteriota bacterium]